MKSIAAVILKTLLIVTCSFTALEKGANISRCPSKRITASGTEEPEQISSATNVLQAIPRHDMIAHNGPWFSGLNTTHNFQARPVRGFTGSTKTFREDNPQNLHYTAVSTAPGKEMAEEVQLSVRAGFYREPFLLELSHPDPDAVIYYTLDGSLPDSTSTEYLSPVHIEDRSDYDNYFSAIPTADDWEPPEDRVPKGTILRAIACSPRTDCSPVTSATYFVFPEGDKKFSLPVISIIAGEEEFFSDSSGIYVNGNFLQTGREWERKASLEFFSEDPRFQQDIGVRIHGGNGRNLSQKSLRLYARSEYGENRFYHRIFPQLPYEDYNRLLLRNSGNDWSSTLFRDAAVQTIVGHLNFDTQAYRPAIVFINGEYWGIHNLRERYDKHYLARVYGIDPENLDLLTNEAQTSDTVIVKEGDAVHYNKMVHYMQNNDIADSAGYAYIKTLIDIENFIDYHIAQIFSANFDWPGNNNDYWRLRQENYDPCGQPKYDGRWRWLLYDTDVGFNFVRNNFVHNTLAFATEEGKSGWPNPDWATFLLRTLLTNDEFRTGFINRFADLLNSAFLPERTSDIISGLRSVIEPEIPGHIRRWNSPVSLEQWESNVDEMTEFALQRPGYQRDHIREYFNLDGDATITLSVENPLHGFIRINTLDILPSTPGVPQNPYPWSGTWYQGIPVRVEAVPRKGYSFSHWSGTDSSDESILNIVPEEDMYLEANFVKEVEEEIAPVISYWFFDTTLANDTPLDSIMPVFSRTENPVLTYRSSLWGYPFDEDHEFWRMASLERRNAPTDINYYPGLNNDISFEDSGMRGIQVRQPLAADGDENTLVFHLPTTGHTGIELRFAAMDECAASALLIDYSVSGGEPEWTNGLEDGRMVIDRTYRLYHLDMSTVEEAGDNPDFKVRIRFDADDMYASEGNRVTFNNFSLHGTPAELVSTGGLTANDPEVTIYPIPARDVIRIDFSKELDYETAISIVCANGITVAEKTLHPGGDASGYFSLDNIDPGVYFVNIRYGDRIVTRRIIVL